MSSARPSRYLINSLAGRAYVGALDAILSVIARETRPIPRKIDRLLLGIGGHIGDAVIASSALRWVSAALPNASVGVAISSSARPVLEGHPMIRWMHTVDHWKLNRAHVGWVAKRKTSTRTHDRARAEIRDVAYDAAVDLYPYYPNKSVLFWRAGIPRRAGYISGGGGPSLTHGVTWQDSGDHMAARQRRVLRELGFEANARLEYDLPPLRAEAVAKGNLLLAAHGLERGRYVVLHPGSGDVRKEWPIQRWVELAALLGETIRVVVTGAGARDEMIAGQLKAAMANVVDLCGKTDLALLRFVLRESAGVMSIDSAAAHLAAAEGASGVTIMSPMTNVSQWRPLSARFAVIMTNAEADEARQLFLRQTARTR